MTSWLLGVPEPNPLVDRFGALQRWVPWKRKGAAKPILDLAGKPAKGFDETNPAGFYTYAQVEEAIRTGKAQGAGIMLGDGLMGIDLDNVIALARGELVHERWVELVERFPYAYWERSPSASGVKGFIYCPGFTLPSTFAARKGAEGWGEGEGLEVYGPGLRDSRLVVWPGRYFTVTGRAWPTGSTPTPLEPVSAERLQADLTWLWNTFFPPSVHAETIDYGPPPWEQGTRNNAFNSYMYRRWMNGDFESPEAAVEHGRGIDALQRAHDGEGIEGWETTLRNVMKKKPRAPIPEGYFYLNDTNSYMSSDRPDLLMLPQHANNVWAPLDYEANGGKRGPKLTTRILNSEPHHLAGRTFYPYPPRELVHATVNGGHTLVQENGGLRFNTWNSKHIVPFADGDPTPFLRHVDLIFAGEGSEPLRAKHSFLCWLKTALLTSTKVFYAPLIIGRQGIGKSYFTRMMSYCGIRVSSIPPRYVSLRFNDFLIGKQVLVIEELVDGSRRGFAGNSRYNDLKPWITEQKIMVERKGLPVETMPNRFNMLLFSNHDDALNADEIDDRRILVWHSPMVPQDAEYYLTLEEWTQQNAGVILKYLQGYDIQSWLPTQPPPLTLAKKFMIDQAQPEAIQLLDLSIEDGGVISELRVFQLEVLLEWLNRRVGWKLPPHSSKLANVLKRHGFVQKRCGNGKREKRRYWFSPDHVSLMDSPMSELINIAESDHRKLRGENGRSDIPDHWRLGYDEVDRNALT